jgi:hypothetical protein
MIYQCIRRHVTDVASDGVGCTFRRHVLPLLSLKRRGVAGRAHPVPVERVGSPGYRSCHLDTHIPAPLQM